MWWSDPDRRRCERQVRARVCIVLLVVFLAGCGFQPLYGPAEDDTASPPDRMAATRIAPLEGRVGQRLHNLLRDRLNPSGQSSAPAYLLEVQLRKSTTELGIRKDETATRANLTMAADFKLRDFESKAVLLRSRSVSVNSYNILDAFYATTVAEDDATTRALRELADDIRLRLAVYFADPRSAKRP